MTIFEIGNIIYAAIKENETKAAMAIGLLLGMWMLCLVSYLNLHMAWK